MAMERRDPVPPGRYYLYISSDEASTWQAWVTEHRDRVMVVAVEAQTITPDSPVWATTPTGSIIKEHVGDWVLFDVKAPVPWVKLGLPTIVTDPRVRSTQDVYKLPPPEPSDSGPLDQLADALKALTTLATIGGVVIIGSAVFRGVMATRRIK